MQALVVEFRIKAEHIAVFAVAMADNAAQSLAKEPGCAVFDVCRDPNDPRLFFLYELYEDEAAVQAHLQSPHFREMNDATAAWVLHKSVRRLVRA